QEFSFFAHGAHVGTPVEILVFLGAGDWDDVLLPWSDHRIHGRFGVARAAECNDGAKQFAFVLLEFIGIGDGNADDFSFERALCAWRPTGGGESEVMHRRGNGFAPSACALPAHPTAGNFPWL